MSYYLIKGNRHRVVSDPTAFLADGWTGDAVAVESALLSLIDQAQNAIAAKWGYGTEYLTPIASVVNWASFDNPYTAECKKILQWKADAFAWLKAYKASATAAPTSPDPIFAELLAAVPKPVR